MKILGITTEGGAFHADRLDVERISGGKPIATDIKGVYCWSEGGGVVNRSATAYLRSVGSLGANAFVRGLALFGVVGLNGEPLEVNECALEALGWAVTRSLIAVIEADLLARAA